MSKIRNINMREQRTNTPLAPNILNAIYTALVISCFFVYFNFFKIEILGYHMLIPATCVPYTFLYPISYICLRLYGYRQVNNMIASMFFSSVFFFILIKIIHSTSNFDVFFHNHHVGAHSPSELMSIIHSSLYMYLLGLVAMPASIYISFYTLKLLKYFNIFTLSIATAVGEIVNTYIVFPLGMHNHFNTATLLSNVVVSALIFKIVMGILLSALAIVYLRIYE